MGDSNELVVRLAEVGLLIFLGLFVLVIFYAFSRRNRSTFERASHMPLDDDSAPGRETPADQATGKV
ncbi:MAG: cbb3-type cytochrome oxidase subunit 3 [Planctomycetota bacterium]